MLLVSSPPEGEMEIVAMICYEYIGLWFDPGDLKDMNLLASMGWKVVEVRYDSTAKLHGDFTCWALLERPLPNRQS